jgi:hypothetical protein
VAGDNPGSKLDKAKELGSPLPDVVKFSNRMSPAGVPMFYGAFDEDTVLKEICEKRANSQIVTIGTFKTLCDFEILDLTSIPNMPSIFDKKKRETRSKILFLQSFVREIQKSIKKDGREHIEYVPTQILTEYYRRIFNTKSREKLMGIFYPSTQNKGRTCCVLFVQNENCYNVGEKEDNGKKMLLQLVSTKRISIP